MERNVNTWPVSRPGVEKRAPETDFTSLGSSLCAGLELANASSALPHLRQHEVKDRQPVRRLSHKAQHCEAAIWRSTSRNEIRTIVRTARRFDRAGRQAGRRNGPLGGVALELIELLANLVDFRTGRLEPSIGTLMRLLKRCRSAVVGALQALRRHGFLDWIRRYVPTGMGGRGPQVQQTSNAYRLSLPENARALLGHWVASPPMPEDAEHERALGAARLQDYQEHLPPEELPFFLHGRNPLSESLARLGSLIRKRESAKRTESRVNYITRAEE